METGSITQYYEKDHDRLDQLFKEFQRLKSVNFSKAKENFREFTLGLKRHIVWEEAILFPLFEDKTGMKGVGPTAVMRLEHRQIKELLEAIHDKIRQQDAGSGAEETKLLDVLRAHNQKEEQILYPAIDRLLGDEDRQGVFDRMKQVAEDTFFSCCPDKNST